MNLVLENVQPSHIPVFRELASSLHIKMRKEELEKKQNVNSLPNNKNLLMD
jgi:hypothetical protein